MIAGKTKREISNLAENNRISENAVRCREKFLRFFPNGFEDEKYVAWERGYKWQAHEKWNAQLNRAEFQSLLEKREFSEIASRAVKIESPTNLIFSFEKLALRDGVRSAEGARIFAESLYDFLHGAGKPKQKFERWLEAVGRLPKKQSRVLTHPIVTVFGFIAQPKKHIFLKPKVTQAAARAYGFDFQYRSKLSWETYASLLEFAETIKRDSADLKPRDMIDVQSFIWVLGSDEYR
ncbi:MAG TPA: hypothetical protein VF648_11240 [Pyrinomonadaceae bacterium]|jgi:hypothetical protein